MAKSRKNRTADYLALNNFYWTLQGNKVNTLKRELTKREETISVLTQELQDKYAFIAAIPPAKVYATVYTQTDSVSTTNAAVQVVSQSSNAAIQTEAPSVSCEAVQTTAPRNCCVEIQTDMLTTTEIATQTDTPAHSTMSMATHVSSSSVIY